VENFLSIPITTEGSLDMKEPCAREDIHVPHFIYAIHITDMSNVRSFSVRHRIIGEVFRKDIATTHSCVGVPLAFDEEIPEKMFIMYPKRMSAIPTTPRYDSSSDVTIHLEAASESEVASATAVLSVGYLHYGYNLHYGFCDPYQLIQAPQLGIPLYFVNGKELSASVHDFATFTSYAYGNTRELIEHCSYDDDNDTRKPKQSQWSWFQALFPW
jgi:hypothetical protein